MTERHALVHELSEGRRKFLELVAEVRPELHRYCARMTGSVTDGEDIVQETLARAYYALPEITSETPLRGWLFRIAHNLAIDHLRRHQRRPEEPLEAESIIDPTIDPEDTFAQSEAVQLAVSCFLGLAPAQRSAVILKDVLGHSLEDIAALLSLSIPAVKAALHRGRGRLHALPQVNTPELPTQSSPEVARYIALFNARDWDSVRALLADEVRLELISRVQRAGRHDVGSYFTNYDIRDDWHLVPAWLEGRAVVAVFRSQADVRPSYLIELTFVGGRLTLIRDFRYVPYIALEAEFRLEF